MCIRDRIQTALEAVDEELQVPVQYQAAIKKCSTDKMEQMLSVISTELMPELDMLAKCHHSEAPAAPETPAEK